MTDSSPPQELLLRKIMDIQRKYAHEEKNAKGERQEKIEALIEKFVAESEPDGRASDETDPTAPQ